MHIIIGLGPQDSPHFLTAPNICAKIGWAASICANRSIIWRDTSDVRSHCLT
jgi:hypothetical protein